jgi:hypothetical protein
MGRGEFRGPALLASAVGRLLVQEGRGDKALLLSQSDSLGRFISDGQWWVKWWPVRSRAARSAAEWWEGKSGVSGGFLGDIQSRDKGGPTHLGQR